ncbi:MAG: phosphoserine phosphatase SerB [Acidobacteriota bacterium]
MECVLTLATGRRDGDLLATAIRLATAAAAGLGVQMASEAIELTAARAVDLPFEGAEPSAVERSVRDVLGEQPVDLAAQPRAGRRKRLLVADMESTVIANEMLDDLGARAGIGQQVAEITARAMRSELDFRAALAERLALLDGLDAKILDTLRAGIRVDPGARALVGTMRASGATTVLVTGGFDVFADPVAAQLGFDRWHANRLRVESGRIVGTVVEPLLDRGAKRRLHEELRSELGLERCDTLAVGDGANDLELLAASGFGAAFHAKPAVRAAAAHRVEHGDLSTLLYFQGFTESEIRTD